MRSGIRVAYDNPEKSVLRWEFRGRWTWDDWYQGVQRALELRRAIYEKPCVPAIFDMKGAGPVPMGLLPHARAAAEMMDPRDYVVIAHASGFIRSVTETFRLLNPSFRDKVLLANSVEDARALITRLLHP
jgi:hypothetical protein